ncbi:glycoside hydrolase family 3 C-terminal domain-containing protein [Microbacterium sp. AG1240]|uniref:glycoside hydrolase family 3 C-terminal domain-containing protein n=1 Tax=Microbacterium sp. AG1240 TaxID=2183992 RepID=UPI000EB0B6D0|nr:glycoside hydrolase family 3 C-terminal domain-containing protein [Microbacterium sp. AG1240]
MTDTNPSLTTEEKASLTSGSDFWHTEAVERAGIPSLMLTDGPHGVRRQRESSEQLDLADSVPSTCFPPAAGMASSFDVELVERVGRALGDESAAADVDVLLGPGVNIKRSPLCGRNFEYFSEDPLVSGELGAAWVRGVQSRGVGASLKHFAANNQEHDRMRVSSDVDPRALREIYLRGFQRVVEDAKPWTVMCSYNRINGVFASQNRWLLTSVLRDEWGFDGIVMSDWGAVDDRVAALAAGLDLEMPGNDGRTDAQIVSAVEDGSLDAGVLDVAVERLRTLAERTRATPRTASTVDHDAHHALAREAAGRSLVLLKNEGDLLPLSPSARVAVIGEFAERPRFQGAGSSLINPTRLDIARDEIQRATASEVTYARGFDLDGRADADELARLRSEAIDAAAAADVAVVFLGLPAKDETEGADRAHIDLPADQLDLLDAVLSANPHTVVVLSHGGVVALPFADRVPAILDGWLLGQAGGGATADVLFGIVNPSGRLAETVPLRLSDSPAFLDFPGEFGHVRYSEGLFVGYRWYDARDVEVAFPFGHGLSYTSFSYSDASATVTASGDVEVQVTVTNTGLRAGREVVQVYSGLPRTEVQRAPRELRGFASVELAAGASTRVEMTVRRADLTYWDRRVDQWILESGTYRFDIGASSRDIRHTMELDLEGDVVTLPLSESSSLGEIARDPAASAVMREIAASRGEQGGLLMQLLDPETEMGGLNVSFPAGRLRMMGLSDDEIRRLVG